MKANAPEKIYLYSYSTDEIYEVETKPLEWTVEYTRTDTFIEKAVKWINEHTSLSEKLVIENFRKYMKGE